jgi:Mlc titration factor MtfA (ptsG expression regulator)
MAILQRNFSHWSALDRDEQERLRGHIQVFLAEKNFVGCGGLEISDEIRVTIAAQACLLLLNRRADYFPRMKSILVYPAGFVAPIRHAGPGGFVVETEQPRSGESWYRGPIVLSWDDVAQGADDATDGYNVVLHEFAHQLRVLRRGHRMLLRKATRAETASRGTLRAVQILLRAGSGGEGRGVRVEGAGVRTTSSVADR